jgi:hypothetical protein
MCPPQAKEDLVVGEVGCAAAGGWAALAAVPAVDSVAARVAARGRLAGGVDPGQVGEVGSVEGVAADSAEAGVAEPAAGSAVALR